MLRTDSQPCPFQSQPALRQADLIESQPASRQADVINEQQKEMAQFETGWVDVFETGQTAWKPTSGQ